MAYIRLLRHLEDKPRGKKIVRNNQTYRQHFEVPEHAVVYREKPELLLIGCLRRSCADLIDRYGFWVMPGKVQRAMSVTEMVEAGGDDEIVHINDVCDISEATLLPDE